MLRLLSCLLLTVTVASSPWMLGGSSPWCYALAPLGLLCAAVALLGASLDLKLSWASWSTLVIIGLLLGYVWLQILPLPDGVLSALTSRARVERLNALLEMEGACGPRLPSVTQQPWDKIASDPVETKRQWVILAASAAACLISMLLASDERCRLAIVAIMAVNGAAFSVLAILQRASAPRTIFGVLEVKSQNPPFGAFINRNHAGLFLAISGLFALFGICLLLSQRVIRRNTGLTLDADRSYERAISLTDLRMIWLSQKDFILFAFAFCALMCAMSSVVAGSRSGALAFCAVIAVASIMLFVAGADRRLVIVIGVLGTVVALAPGARFLFLLDRFKTDSLEGGLSGRFGHWSDVLDQTPEFAVSGIGYGNYAYATLPYLSESRSNWFQHADNQFIEAFVELGAIGSFLVLSLAAAILLRSISLIRTKDSQARIVGLFGVGLFAAGTINAMADFALAMPGVMLSMAIGLGFVLGYRQAAPHNKRTVTHATLSIAIRLATIGVLFAATAIGLAHFTTSTNPIARDQDPAQWLARTVSERIGEPNPKALVNDARQYIAQFAGEVQRQIEAVEPDTFEPEMYTLENLAMLKQASEIDDDDQVMQIIRNQMKNTELLEKARSHFRTCAQLSPMRFEYHLDLARLELILCPGEEVGNRIEVALRINPSSALEAGKAGVISMINGNYERGGELIQFALREEPRMESALFAALKAQLSVQEMTKFILKDDVHLLINAADRAYRANSEWTQRAYIYAHLRQLIESGAATGLSSTEMKYYLAKSKRMSGDLIGAISDLEAACEQWPTPRAWLDELVSVCEENQDWTRAKATLERISTEFPYDPNVEVHIQALTKRMRQ